MHRIVTLKFTDLDGVEKTRSNWEDYSSLSARHINILRTVLGVEQDEELQVWLGSAMHAYNGGWYRKALKYINMSLDRQPELETYLFYYKRVCDHVLSVPLNEDEEKYEVKRQQIVDQVGRLPKPLGRVLAKFRQGDLIFIRCKWCGRYIQYVDPNEGLGFIAGGANSCMYCEMSYPMPSWIWDSPDGRAYSYYRLSFPRGKGGEKFYKDFLKDYEPKPTVEESGLFSEI